MARSHQRLEEPRYDSPLEPWKECGSAGVLMLDWFQKPVRLLFCPFKHIYGYLLQQSWEMNALVKCSLRRTSVLRRALQERWPICSFFLSVNLSWVPGTHLNAQKREENGPDPSPSPWTSKLNWENKPQEKKIIELKEWCVCGWSDGVKKKESRKAGCP